MVVMPPEKTNITNNRSTELEKKLKSLLLALDEFMPSETLIKNPDSLQTQSEDLTSALNVFAAVLSEHVKFIEKHIIAMENLTSAVNKLDNTIKKEASLAAKQPSIELKEAINSFLEYQINPQFYHDPGYLKLPVAPDGIYPDSGKKTKHQKQKPSENQ
jgi:hypothetical protein